MLSETENREDLEEAMLQVRGTYHGYGTVLPERRKSNSMGMGILDGIPQLYAISGFAQQAYEMEHRVGIKRYNSQLPDFYERFEKYLEEQHYYENHVIRIDLGIANDGKCVADDVYILLKLPEDLDVRDEFRLPVEPDPPREPQPDESVFDSPLFRSSIYRNLSTPLIMPREPNVTGPKLQAASVISFRVRKAKHNMTAELDPFFIVFEDLDAVRNFSIAYTLIADNVGDKITGELHVIVQVV